MRIRSTKPEFYRSRTVASVDWDARFVLKALESYVDDNGVGKDDIELIASDTFPRDLAREGSRILARLAEAIGSLHQAGLVWRYEADGQPLIYISSWESVQRIDKPQAGRFPRPDGTFDYKSSVIGESDATAREASRSLAPGTGEQGNRGTGEQGKKAAPPSADAPPEQVATANAYERTGKAFNFAAIRGIAKWAIAVRGESASTVEEALVAIYEMGKPITKQVLGQYLDGHLAPRRPGGADVAADILRAELRAVPQIGAGR